MKRIACLMMLTALSSPAYARDSYSFVVGGHRIHVEASRHCRSLSCVSVSVPGVGNWHHGRRDADDVATASNPAPAPAPAAQPSEPTPAQRQARPVYAAPLAQVTPAAQPASSATRAQIIPPAVQVQPEARKDSVQDKPAAELPAPGVNAPIARVSQPSETIAATPAGDWQTEAKNGTVRIEACGQALCGYMLNVSTGTKGETILINMKPKSGTDDNDTKWSGHVYSRSSGNSYYGSITLKEPNTLRVEACAFGSFFCSGNNWTRLQDSQSVRPDHEVANSRQDAHDPRS